MAKKKKTKKKKRKNKITSQSINDFNNPLLIGEDALSMLADGKVVDGETRFQAQELVYEAMETDDLEKAITLVTQALQLNPRCVDAIVMLTDLTSETLDDWIAGLNLAVKLGRQDLSEDFFEENAGYFWGLIETRPYMRARQQLVELLIENGQSGLAMEHCREMVELNPNDNQGMRYVLLGLYLLNSRYADCEKLLKDYEKDTMAMFTWGRLLLGIAQGKLADAVKLLANARKSNPYIEEFLTGLKPVPNETPDFYGIGDEKEAIVYIHYLKPAWEKHREALNWLKRQEPAKE